MDDIVELVLTGLEVEAELGGKRLDAALRRKKAQRTQKMRKNRDNVKRYLRRSGDDV